MSMPGRPRRSCDSELASRRRATKFLGASSEQPVLGRMWWGLRIGTLFGLVLASAATILFILGGESVFTSLHSSFLQVTMTDIVGGAVAGCVVGVLRPLAASKAGAAAVGFLAAIPVSVL